jgi:hypothetical protein
MVTVHDGGDLRRISRELRKMDQKEILKRFRKDLRAAAAPLIPAVRTSIRAIPSKRAYSATGLRGRLSRATTLEVKTAGARANVKIIVTGRKMPDHQKALPAYMEGKRKPWRHPVYGNKNNWVQQQPPSPYFYKVVEAKGPAIRAVINHTIANITRDIL